MGALPTVTAVMPVYNGEAFVAEAIDSALGQDYPAELLDMVVVDDGSTDATAEIVRALAARAPGRVRLVQQANGGNVSAVNTAIEHSTGELIAMLDADDVWPADKTRRQVELLARRPEVGLVYGDMRVIDAHGHVMQESWLEGDDPPHGVACGARMLIGNCATASSLMWRRALLDRIAPIPAAVPFADWWLSVCAAELGEIGYLPEPRTLYRFHGANMSLGTQGDERRRELRKAMSLQRMMLRRAGRATGPYEDLALAWEAFERNAREALELAGSPFAALVTVTEDDRREAGELAARAAGALERGDAEGALLEFMNAAAADPWLDAARDGIADALVVLRDDPDCPGQRPLAGARGFVVLVFADELAESPALLRELAERMAGADMTVAIDATGYDPGTGADVVHALASNAGVGDAEDVDLLAVLGPLDTVGRARLARGTNAVWSDRGARGHLVPLFRRHELDELRKLAELGSQRDGSCGSRAGAMPDGNGSIASPSSADSRPLSSSW